MCWALERPTLIMYYLVTFSYNLNKKDSDKIDIEVARQYSVIYKKVYYRGDLTIKCYKIIEPLFTDFYFEQNFTDNILYIVFYKWGKLLNFVCEYDFTSGLHEFNINP